MTVDPVEVEARRIHLVPVSFDEATKFVEAWHRHNAPPVGHKFSIGAASVDGVLRGVVMVGRPTARMSDTGDTLEVTRSCTDGTPNVNSMLYGAAARVTFGLGYTRLITYTQAGESGASLKAAGWKVVAERPARPGWSTPSRPRDNGSYLSTHRTLWEAS